MIESLYKIFHFFESWIIKYRRLIITLVLLFQAALANYLAFVIRFESILTTEYRNLYLGYLPLLLLIRLAFLIQGGLHKGLWRYASISDLVKIIKTATLGNLTFLLLVRYLLNDAQYPLSIYVLDWLLFIIIGGGSRLLVRILKEYVVTEPIRKKILIVGAGDAGEMILREIKSKRESPFEPIGFIDDDIRKKGLTIHGVPIIGSSERLQDIIMKYKPDEVLISSPDTQKSIREIYEKCKPFNIQIKKLPGVNDLLDGNVSTAAKLGQRLVDVNLVSEEHIREALALQEKEGGRLGSKLVKLGHISEERLISFLNKQYGISLMKPISLEDLLQREPVKTDISEVRDFIRGKSVLVTGAGGSIGSELCRQIMKYNPSNLLLLDRYENTLYQMDLEMRSEENGSFITTIVGDIQDTHYLDRLFSKHKPQIVFHAAAYKHVPLMESSPIEAIRNNVFGTKNLIDTAARHYVENFVLISTDKAVNPTSVMGATKRIAEYLTIGMNCSCKTKFTAVRFGNVLGSNGSVVPIFKEQLKKGGPLTVTHPDIRRFFMLIPEAVQLVLIAAAAGKGGDLFVLDMGDPIKIAEFAENFIRLSGFIPHKEIKIVFTGLRPGEKLYEEIFDETEKRIPTFHDKLMIADPEVPSMEVLNLYISDLEQIVRDYSIDEVIPILQKIIPSFRNHVHDHFS